MPRSFQLSDLLMSITPDALCDDCIADRVPLSARPYLPDMLAQLNSKHYEHTTAECAACCATQQVACYVGTDTTNRT
jgi:hypothetical protein